MSDEQLEAAARAVFEERGAGAPLALVAARLGVSTAAVLHRVGSKERLLALAAAPRVPASLARLREPPGERPGEALAGLLLELLGSLEAAVPSLVLRRSTGLGGAPGVAPTVALRRALGRWLRQVSLKVPAPVAAEALLGAVEARAFNRALGGPAFAPGSDRAFVGRLIAGLVGR